MGFDFDFPKNSSGRRFSINYYKRQLCNGETYDRSWLVYSQSKNAIFCFCCKLFSTQKIFLSTVGYNDWGHVSIYLIEHEKSKHHLEAYKDLVNLATRLKFEKTIDAFQQKMLDAETRHWRNILERLIAIVHFLGQQCLPFRGTSDKLYEYN